MQTFLDIYRGSEKFTSHYSLTKEGDTLWYTFIFILPSSNVKMHANKIIFRKEKKTCILEHTSPSERTTKKSPKLTACSKPREQPVENGASERTDEKRGIPHKCDWEFEVKSQDMIVTHNVRKRKEERQWNTLGNTKGDTIKSWSKCETTSPN